jgi:hypothetical protein
MAERCLKYSVTTEVDGEILVVFEFNFTSISSLAKQQQAF